MDGGDGSSVDPQAINRLSEADKTELAQLIQLEQSRDRVRQSINTLSSMCWKKCIQGPIRSSTLNGGEEACLSNCVARFFETNDTVIMHIASKGRS